MVCGLSQVTEPSSRRLRGPILIAMLLLTATAGAQPAPPGSGSDPADLAAPPTEEAQSAQTTTEPEQVASFDPLGPSRWLCSPRAIVERARSEVGDDTEARRARARELADTMPTLPSLSLPEPEHRPPRELREVGESPSYWRLPEPETRPLGVRAAFAFSAQANDTRGERVTVGIDSSLYARIGVGRGESYWALWPEAGYSFAANGDGQRHLGMAGFGLALQRWDYAIGYLPRFVGGTVQGAQAVGLRHGVLGEVARGLLALELGHTWLAVDGGGAMHMFDARLSVDVLGLVAAIVGDYDPTDF